MNITTKPELRRHLETAGHKVVSLEEIFTGGATQCRYFSLFLENGDRRFIKIGEKVDYEIENLNYLNEINFAESPKILAGSDSRKKVLVINWATIPRFGYISSHDYRREDDEKLSALAKMIRG